MRLVRRIAILLGLALLPLVMLVLGFAFYVYLGVREGGAEPVGTLAGLGVHEPVRIMRDGRGIPHVRARNDRDLYFAEGYLQGCDRLFQLDLYRRLVAGRLSEVFGKVTESVDEQSRIVDVPAIARAQLAALPTGERANLDAFAAGVNAAIDTRPLPPEFRVMAYRPERWTAFDSLVTSFSTVLALTDSWDDVAMRQDVRDAVGPAADDAFFSISDPAYDAPTAGTGHAPVAKLPPLSGADANAPQLYVAHADSAEGRGSNDYAAGATRTATHRALLANDPHLELRMPGIWWLADLQSPSMHVAGATLAGVPGIVIGHNAHLAWGATNGTVATVRVFREHFRTPASDEYFAGHQWLHARHRRETILVRFEKPVVRDYLRTRNGFVFADRGDTKLAAAWTADEDRRTSLDQFDGLARARTVADAQRVLARYPGPPQNFVLADDAGNAGFSLAGEIPNDAAWGLQIQDGQSASGRPVAYVAPSALPHVAAARDALVFTANARSYGAGYPYRLSAAFAPPYRAARIRELLRAPLDVSRFAAIQADVMSLPERDLARATLAAVRAKKLHGDDVKVAVAALETFDGHMDSASHGATYAVALRLAAIERLVRFHLPTWVAYRYVNADSGSAFVAVERMLRERPRGWVPNDDYDAFLTGVLREAIDDLRARHDLDRAWSDVGYRVAAHPLASFGLSMWNGARFPGLGDAYSPHVQAPANAQSFRAVWDIGRWESGGMVIPQGESGEPGSPHYRDAAATWLAGTLVPLPFDESAVTTATVSTFTLAP